MTSSTAAAILSFGVVLVGWELLISVADVPRTAGPILGIGAAMWMSGMLLRTGRTSERRTARPVDRATFSQEIRARR